MSSIQVLPRHPDLRHYKARAKELLDAARAGDTEALRRIDVAVGRRPDRVTLADAQLTLAREHGFAGWPRFKRRIDALAAAAECETPIVAAVDAIHAGDVDALRALLREHPTLAGAQQSGNRYSLIHEVSRAEGELQGQRVAMAEALLAAGAPIDAYPGMTATPLHFAASLGHEDLAVCLAEHGASLHACDMGDGGTPIVQALFYGHTHTAQRLAEIELAPDNLRVAAGLGRLDRLAAFFTPDGRLTPEAGRHREFYRPHDESPPHTFRFDDQETLDDALTYAAANGQAAAAMFLLDHGANIDGKPYFATALHFAAFFGHREVTELLLERGADATIRDDMYGGDAAGWAHHAGRAALRDLIAGWGRAAPDEAHTNPPLFVAAQQGDVEAVHRQLQQGADPNTTGRVAVTISGRGLAWVGQSALSAAAERRHHAVCHVLIKAGAIVSPFDAAELGDLQAVQQALDRGFALEARDDQGRSLLHHAVIGHAVATAAYLLDRGADVNASADTFTFGRRAIDLAKSTNAPPQMMNLLLVYGASR